MPGTTVHIIYALKMGKKYEKRYRRHFAHPDIMRFNMQHEGWLLEKKWRKKVMSAVIKRMNG